MWCEMLEDCDVLCSGSACYQEGRVWAVWLSYYFLTFACAAQLGLDETLVCGESGTSGRVKLSH